MVNQNTRQLVKEALDKGWVIYSELKQARDTASDARNALNGLKGEIDSPAYREAGEEKLAKRIAELTSNHEKAIASAHDALEKAQVIFKQKEDESLAILSANQVKVEEEWAKELAAHNRTLELQATEAQATAHRLEQQAGVLSNTLDRFRQQTQAQLGVDLGKLLETP